MRAASSGIAKRRSLAAGEQHSLGSEPSGKLEADPASHKGAMSRRTSTQERGSAGVCVWVCAPGPQHLWKGVGVCVLMWMWVCVWVWVWAWVRMFAWVW